MNSGLKPLKPSHKDYSYKKTFKLGDISTFADSLNLDLGLTNPNQNADGLPEACTGYTQTDICTDEDHIVYQPRFTYDKTLFMEGDSEGSPCDLRTSLDSTRLYGVLAQGETTDEQAFRHRRGQYFLVQKTTDWFDSFRTVMVSSRRPISVGTPFYKDWLYAPTGRVTELNSFPIDANTSWHNWKICGWKTINGQPYLIGKVWLGSSWADNGFGYFSRNNINGIMSVQGSSAFTIAQIDQSEVQRTGRIYLLQQYLLIYLQRFLSYVAH